MFEVSPTGTVVWILLQKGGEIVRALRYAPSFSGISVKVTPTATELFSGESASFNASGGFTP
jgi:hypothetical protein